MLEISGIEKAIAGKLILRDVHFCVQPGQLAAVIGPSGSGKTTLLKCITGIATPDAGQISLGSEVYSEYSERQRRNFRLRKIGVVDQENRLVEDLTCRDNIRLIAELALKNKRKSHELADDILVRLNMESHKNCYPGSLSGGERQRISIGCALANSPSLIAADEPTSNLDDASADNVISIFIELAQYMQIPVVVVTHDSRVIKRADFAYKISGSNDPI